MIGDTDTLACPYCKDDFLHHGRVAVFHDPHGEDGKRIIKNRVMGRDVVSEVVDRRQSRNPSNRRDGVGIFFWCEGCGQHSELTFAQHKGQTLVAWCKCDVGTEAKRFNAQLDLEPSEWDDWH